MRKRNLFALSITCLRVVLVIPFMVVCAEAAPMETLHLGATVPFQSRVGIQIKNILLMNADLLNKAGGLTVGGKTYKIEYHIYDNKSQADPARVAIERLVFRDKIKFDVGTFGTACLLAMLPVTEPNKVPIFGLTGSDKLLSPQYKYFVRTYSGTFAVVNGRVLHELRPDIKTALQIAYDDETGHAVFEKVAMGCKHYGIELFPPLYFKRGETDFSRIATKAVSLKPDYIRGLAIDLDAEYIQLIKALREAGYKGIFEGSYLTQKTVDEIVAKVGKEGAEGIYVGFGDPTFSGLREIPKAALDFRKNYENYYGTWDTAGLQWVGSWYTWLAAVRKADSLDPDKVMGAIDKDLKIISPITPGKFFRRPDLGNNKYCDYATATSGGRIKDGKIVFLWERDEDYFIDTIEAVYGIKVR